jgi:hypothetical protein
MRFSVGAKRPKFELLAAFCLVPLSLGISEPALAQCSGPLDNVKCTVTGNTYSSAVAGNPYQTSAGINVNAVGTPNQVLMVTLDQGVQVVIPSGFPGTNAVNLANIAGPPFPPGASATLLAPNVTITNIDNSTSANVTGLRIQSAGSAIIGTTANPVSGQIDVAGTASEDAILAIVQGNNPVSANAVASVTYSGPGLTSSGTESTGIQADNRGNGNATIVASGNITGTPGVGGSGFYGLIAHAGDSVFTQSGAGNASVTYNSGTINVFGDRPRGIVAWAEGDGSAMVITGPGTVINVSGSNNPGGGSPNFTCEGGDRCPIGLGHCGERSGHNCDRGLDNHELRVRDSRYQYFQQPCRYSNHQLCGRANDGDLHRPGHHDPRRGRRGHRFPLRQWQHNSECVRADQRDGRLQRSRHPRR